jgi:hypothetical protein
MERRVGWIGRGAPSSGPSYRLRPGPSKIPAPAPSRKKCRRREHAGPPRRLLGHRTRLTALNDGRGRDELRMVEPDHEARESRSPRAAASRPHPEVVTSAEAPSGGPSRPDVIRRRASSFPCTARSSIGKDPALSRRGGGFDSLTGHSARIGSGRGKAWLIRKLGGLEIAGSNPAALTGTDRDVGETGIRLLWEQETAGSTPAIPTGASDMSPPACGSTAEQAADNR